MSHFETLSLLIPWLALVISVYTFVQQRKLQREANDLQKATSELAKRQLQSLERDESDRLRAKLALELVGKPGSHLLVLRNVGVAEARRVQIESLGEHSPLVQHQVDSLFPLASLRAAEEVRLGAVLFLEGPAKFPMRLHWVDPDGTQRSDDFELVR